MAERIWQNELEAIESRMFSPGTTRVNPYASACVDSSYSPYINVDAWISFTMIFPSPRLGKAVEVAC